VEAQAAQSLAEPVESARRRSSVEARNILDHDEFGPGKFKDRDQLEEERAPATWDRFAVNERREGLARSASGYQERAVTMDRCRHYLGLHVANVFLEEGGIREVASEGGGGARLKIEPEDNLHPSRPQTRTGAAAPGEEVGDADRLLGKLGHDASSIGDRRRR
jgi:hypothetical protein